MALLLAECNNEHLCQQLAVLIQTLLRNTIDIPSQQFSSIKRIPAMVYSRTNTGEQAS
jgi:hypothetical protein